MGGGLNACREVEVCHLLLEFGFGMRGHCKTISVMGFWVGGTEGRGGGSRSVCQKSGQERNLKEQILRRVDQSIRKWFGHMKEDSKKNIDGGVGRNHREGNPMRKCTEVDKELME